MQLVQGVRVWGDQQENAVNQAAALTESAEVVALMADHHLGYSQPIGGVVGYSDHISPSGVGFDIACGNKAVMLDMSGEDLRKSISTIMDDVWEHISFGIGQRNNLKVDHALFDDPLWADMPDGVYDKARRQLGTIGSGNHYVDLFTDEEDRVWIGVHFGSRGFGHGIATRFLKAAGAKDGVHADACLIRADSDLGQDYIQHMELAGQYAYAGRDWVCDRVATLLGASVIEEVHNHHNFAWRESHGGRDLWVIRKGATPAAAGQRGFVGGSMGDISVILEGVESAENSLGLYSTVHGAGRVMSRTRAAGKRRRRWACESPDCDWLQPPGTHRPDWCPACGSTEIAKAMVQVSVGEVTQGMMNDWVAGAGVELRGAGLDESPHCYKRLPEVLDAHSNSINILHTLTPVGVAMAG